MKYILTMLLTLMAITVTAGSSAYKDIDFGDSEAVLKTKAEANGFSYSKQDSMGAITVYTYTDNTKTLTFAVTPNQGVYKTTLNMPKNEKYIQPILNKIKKEYGEVTTTPTATIALRYFDTLAIPNTHIHVYHNHYTASNDGIDVLVELDELESIRHKIVENETWESVSDDASRIVLNSVLAQQQGKEQLATLEKSIKAMRKDGEKMGNIDFANDVLSGMVGNVNSGMLQKEMLANLYQTQLKLQGEDKLIKWILAKYTSFKKYTITKTDTARRGVAQSDLQVVRDKEQAGKLAEQKAKEDAEKAEAEKEVSDALDF